MTDSRDKLERFVFDHDAFKKWWNSNTEVTGDENTAWLAWCAALANEGAAPQKIGHFDICKAMAERGMDIRMSLLDNVILLNKVKSGTEVTIGCDGDLVAAIYQGKFLGGLLLCDREQYRQIEKELNESAATA